MRLGPFPFWGYSGFPDATTFLCNNHLCDYLDDFGWVRCLRCILVLLMATLLCDILWTTSTALSHLATTPMRWLLLSWWTTWLNELCDNLHSGDPPCNTVTNLCDQCHLWTIGSLPCGLNTNICTIYSTLTRLRQALCRFPTYTEQKLFNVISLDLEFLVKKLEIYLRFCNELLHRKFGIWSVLFRSSLFVIFVYTQIPQIITAL